MTPIGKYSEGSRKNKVFDCFVQNGPDVAWTLGHKLGLKPNTLRSWFSSWRSVRPNDKKSDAKVKVKVANAAKAAAKPKAAKPKANSKKAKVKVNASPAEAAAA